MTKPLDWRDAIRDLGWSKAELGRRLRVHENTVLNWRERCPGYAIAYLELALEVRRLGQLVERGK